ncbi:hypothetical protein EDD16DRAFT_1519620 [Pisolithus croceorrhizus]|nr:hypothetical protein EV401DRAFT_1895747 [Pisolithus croceorrhizus]KAI6119070.1 hypothetical protein EDD16DRAFT_1519620 [Pisolithus croceorrhizus]KAI6137781.1 hypothetical protein EDD17DRAFT_1517081 [Pisolithus thermaeus]
MGKPTRQQAMLQHSCGRVPKGKVNVITRKTEVMKPFSKLFGQVPKHKAEDDTVGPPAKRRMAESCINHVPKHKAEGNAARLPPKRRAVKSSGITHDMPQECHLWQLPNELLSDIADLLDTDLLWKLSQVSKLLQGISSRRYLAAVGFKLLIVGWLDANEANCEALPVWRCIAFRAVHTLWFTSLRTLGKQQLGAMCTFFDSLKDTQAIQKVHIHLYIDPTCLPPIFGTLLESIQCSGCTELHASTHGISGCSICIPHKVYLSPSSLTSLVSLNISSPILFFPHSIQFTLSVLQITLLKSL